MKAPLLLILSLLFSARVFADDIALRPRVVESALEEFRKQPRYPMPYFVSKLEWSENDEKNFSNFIAQFGRAVASKKCSSVRTCMKSRAANPYAPRDPDGLIMYADCADFPYLLRAYFAYQNGLPMSYVKQIKMSDRPYSSRNDRDDDLPTARLDNSPYGNLILTRGGTSVAARPGEERNLVDYLADMFENVSTRTFRVGPLSPNYDLSDLYPIKIRKGAVAPGVVVHSTGHAYLVYDVDEKGVVRLIDAHPDGSISSKELTAATLDRSRPDHGLGLLRFRPVRLTSATMSGLGYYGGVLTTVSDDELFSGGKWSVEQWFGPDVMVEPRAAVAPDLWREAFAKQNFFDFVSDRLRSSSVVLYADEEVRNSMLSICTELQQRVSDVDVAVSAAGEYRLNTKEHPAVLPQNIYSAEEPWESTSSPSRDSRLKAAAQDLIKNAVKYFHQAKAGQGGMKFDGSPEDYAAAMQKRLAEVNAKCSLSYVNSSGVNIPLVFQNAVARLNRFSFDPYHCAERRWGALGVELQSCVDEDKGSAWYKAQQVMRNVVRKTNASERLSIRSDRPITLEMLADPRLIDQPDESAVNLGTRVVPNTDIGKSFSSAQFLEQLKDAR